jgi:hypothetical protein
MGWRLAISIFGLAVWGTGIASACRAPADLRPAGDGESGAIEISGSLEKSDCRISQFIPGWSSVNALADTYSVLVPEGKVIAVTVRSKAGLLPLCVAGGEAECRATVRLAKGRHQFYVTAQKDVEGDYVLRLVSSMVSPAPTTAQPPKNRHFPSVPPPVEPGGKIQNPPPSFDCQIEDEDPERPDGKTIKTIICNLDSKPGVDLNGLKFEFLVRLEGSSTDVQAGDPVPVAPETPWIGYRMQSMLLPGKYSIFLTRDAKRLATASIEVPRPEPTWIDCAFEKGDPERGVRTTIGCRLKPGVKLGGTPAEFRFSVRFAGASTYLQAGLPVPVDADSPEATYRMQENTYPGRYRIGLWSGGEPKGGFVELSVGLPE